MEINSRENWNYFGTPGGIRNRKLLNPYHCLMGMRLPHEFQLSPGPMIGKCLEFLKRRTGRRHKLPSANDAIVKIRELIKNLR